MNSPSFWRIQPTIRLWWLHLCRSNHRTQTALFFSRNLGTVSAEPLARWSSSCCGYIIQPRYFCSGQSSLKFMLTNTAASKAIRFRRTYPCGQVEDRHGAVHRVAANDPHSCLSNSVGRDRGDRQWPKRENVSASTASHVENPRPVTSSPITDAAAKVKFSATITSSTLR